MSADLARIVPTDFSSAKSKGLLGALGLRPKLTIANADSERDLVFLVALRRYDPRCELDWRAIATVYARCAGANAPACRVVGSHWELVGFQGADPRTDLNRAMGCLSLLQLLALKEERPELLTELLQLCNAQDQDWPLCCVAIGFTADAVQALRAGKLYKVINKRGAVLPVLHEYYFKKFTDFRDRLVKGEDRFEALNATRSKATKSNAKSAKSSKSAKSNAKLKAEPNDFDTIDEGRDELDQDANLAAFSRYAVA